MVPKKMFLASNELNIQQHLNPPYDCGQITPLSNNLTLINNSQQQYTEYYLYYELLLL